MPRLTDLQKELADLKKFCSHAGILKAQEEHNRMIAELEAEIERLRQYEQAVATTKQAAEYWSLIRVYGPSGTDSDVLKVLCERLEAVAAMERWPRIVSSTGCCDGRWSTRLIEGDKYYDGKYPTLTAAVLAAAKWLDEQKAGGA